MCLESRLRFGFGHQVHDGYLVYLNCYGTCILNCGGPVCLGGKGRGSAFGRRILREDVCPSLLICFLHSKL